ncbi:MAG TPA: hypothetical protein VG452_08395 [Egibacteraceae bacterium]|nr:hypothetical protein [Egibacteraceae bacterium]
MSDDPPPQAPPAEVTPRQLVAFVDEARAQEAARDRARERWLRQQAAESAQLTGLLLAAAERGTRVAVRTASGRTHQGQLVAVGADFCGLVTDAAVETYIATAAITTVRAEVGIEAVPAQDERRPSLDLLLAELLAQEAPERPRVALALAGDPEPVVGSLRAVGVDVATVALDRDRRELLYVRLDAVTEVSFPPR